MTIANLYMKIIGIKGGFLRLFSQQVYQLEYFLTALHYLFALLRPRSLLH